MTADAPRSVRIDAMPGYASVRLDGLELGSELIGYTLQHDIRGGLPTVMLHTIAPEGALYQGLARVVVATDQGPGEAIVEFLRGIDPAALQDAALARDDMDPGRHGTTKAILDQLCEWASGGGS